MNDSHPTMAESSQPGDKAKYEALLQLAERAEESGRSSRAANFYRLAGEAAAAEFHNEIALDCFTRALGYTLESALVDRFGLLLARERLLALKGATLEQSHDLAALETIANFLNEDMYRAQVAARQAAWREATGDLAGAVTVASMATRLAELA
ncbi:MAG: hypothetical protein KDE28_02090, partial [Anaerolineales bacterium]|nr:hypothetical protein [Anaerolineales bacterium]